jgi:CRP-like cAMP-binding protein
MFSQTPRTADVLALTPCNLLFMSAEAFRNMMETEPKLASAVLFALGHIMADRMVAGNQRLQSKASSEFLWL